MNETYEYKFVRLEQDKSWITGYSLPTDSACESYQTLCTSMRARDGG
jgi:hypothetical protein